MDVVIRKNYAVYVVGERSDIVIAHSGVAVGKGYFKSDRMIITNFSLNGDTCQRIVEYALEKRVVECDMDGGVGLIPIVHPKSELFRIAHNASIWGVIIGILVTALLFFFTYRKIKTQKY